MKPLKSFIGIAKWILRIAFLLMIVITYGEEILALEYRNKEFYVAITYLIFATLLFFGSFATKHNLTVFSALILSIISIYTIVIQLLSGFNDSIATMFLFFSISFFFLCNGNNK